MDPRQDRLDTDIIDVTGQRLVAGLAVVRVSGEVDIDTAPEVGEAVRLHLEQQVSSIVLDLREVTFMGSAGLNLLVALKLDCEGRGVDLRLVATTRAVLRPLELTDLTSQFVVAATVEAAEAS